MVVGDRMEGQYMSMSKHRHRAMPGRGIERGFSGPVNNERRDPRADGCVCCVDRCRCGAVRETNVNQCFVERGPWYMPDER